MADPQRMWKENVLQPHVDGAPVFFVERACIFCSICTDIAPACFTADEEAGFVHVARQPGNDRDLEACYQAMENCPVEAIGGL